MFSKKTFASLFRPARTTSILIGLALTGYGCGLHRNPVSSQSLNVNTQLKCMDTMSVTDDQYFNGQSTASDVTAFWDCASHALTYFTQKVKGESADGYSSNELRNFLVRLNYIHSIQLTDSLMAQFGAVKQVFVGGHSDGISLAEINKIQQTFDTLRNISLTMRPYMPLSKTGIKGKPWKDVSHVEIDQFIADLNASATLLGTDLDAVGVPYSFKNFTDLLDAVQEALPETRAVLFTKTTDSIRKHLPLIEQVKSSLLAPSLSMISDGHQWGDLLTSASRWGGVLVKVSWLFDKERVAATRDSHFPDEPYTRGINLQSIGEVYDQVSDLLKDSSVRQPQGIIPFEEIKKIVDLLPVDSLPISAQVIKNLIYPDLKGGASEKDRDPSLFQRLIGGRDLTTTGRTSVGLSPGFISHFDDTFHNWYEGQRFLEELFLRMGKAQSNLGGDLIGKTIFESDVSSKLWQEVYNQTSPQWNPMTAIAARRLESVIHSVPALFYISNSSEITFPTNPNIREAYSFHDLSENNWMLMLVMAASEGYSEEPWTPTSPGLNFEEFDRLFEAVKPAGLELKQFDPDDSLTAAHRFRELDVFTYDSNGDGFMSLNEGLIYLSYLFSAGRKASRIHNDISAKCMTQNPAWVKKAGDKYGQDLIEPHCYREQMFAHTDQYWAPLTDSIAFYKNLDPNKKATYERLLETSARKGGYQENVWMDSSDSQGFAASLQYIEEIYARYDKRKGGTLNPEDADQAFPVFKQTLQKIAAQGSKPTVLSDSNAKLVFTYMLAKGQVPDTTCHAFTSKLKLIAWFAEQKTPLGRYEADRLKILEIFGALAAPANPSCGKTTTQDQAQIQEDDSNF